MPKRRVASWDGGAVLEGLARDETFSNLRESLSIEAASPFSRNRTVHLLIRNDEENTQITRGMAGSLKQFLHTICKILFLLDRIMNSNLACNINEIYFEITLVLHVITCERKYFKHLFANV